MNKSFKSLPLLLVGVLSACQSVPKGKNSIVYYFDTVVSSTLYDGDEEDLLQVNLILSLYDFLADSYTTKDENCVYAINQTNDPIRISEELYYMLQTSFEIQSRGAKYFNPLAGGLITKWEESLEKDKVLSDEIVNEELSKINNSYLLFADNFEVQRVGDATIDLGGIAKGYALDYVRSYLVKNDIKQYMINAGSSSILLGEKYTKDQLFTVKIKDLDNAYFKAKNCFVSTSGISEQSYVINDVTYSHIINPISGSAISANDTVIVISDNGALGDALSTSFMMSSIKEIKEAESKFDVQTIVIKNNKIIYKNDKIEVFYK